MQYQLVDIWSILFTAVSFFFSYWLFASYSGVFFLSLVSAAISAGLAFFTYLMLKMVLLSIGKK